MRTRPELTEEFLNDPAQIALGQELFQGHARSATARAPIRARRRSSMPKKLTPEDVYLRVTYGFRKMPAWEDVFTDEERMAITAYVKSERFSN